METNSGLEQTVQELKTNVYELHKEIIEIKKEIIEIKKILTYLNSKDKEKTKTKPNNLSIDGSTIFISLLMLIGMACSVVYILIK